jgi:ABC-type transport system involved in multi-copper enzyme maturation permease subunit
MKILALVIDTLREIYAKKVIIGIIIIEVAVITIAALILFSEGMQSEYRGAGAHAEATTDSLAAPTSEERTSEERTSEEREKPDEAIDTALLGSDLPDSADSTAQGGRSSRTFDVETGAGNTERRDGARQVILEEMVKGEMGAFAGPITLATIFFGIFIMAGIVPSLMEKGTIDLLLSKPISRPTILFGRALGGFLAIGVNLLLFLLAIYALYGMASGVWIFSFIIFGFAIPMFALLVIYSAIVLLNVITEGSVLPMIIAYIHLMVLGNVLYSREEILYGFIESKAIRSIIDGLYYILPQTGDLFETVPLGIYSGSIDSAAPFIQGIIFAAVMYSLAIWRFQRKDF